VSTICPLSLAKLDMTGWYGMGPERGSNTLVDSQIGLLEMTRRDGLVWGLWTGSQGSGVQIPSAPQEKPLITGIFSSPARFVGVTGCSSLMAVVSLEVLLVYFFAHVMA